MYQGIQQTFGSVGLGHQNSHYDQMIAKYLKGCLGVTYNPSMWNEINASKGKTLKKEIIVA